MATVLVLTAIYALSADISASHLFNTDWHPHSRFHLGQILVMLTVDLGIGLWLLCRYSTDRKLGMTVAALLALAFWTPPILWVGVIVLGADLHAYPTIPVPIVVGIKVYLNVVASLLACALTFCAWMLSAD